MPPYAAGDMLIMYVALKHSSGTPNAGSVAQPPGWSRLGCSLDKGGYSLPLSINEGNTSIYAFYRVIKTGETIPSSVTFDTSAVDIVMDVCFGFCSAWYSSLGENIRVEFTPGGGDVRGTLPLIPMESDCGIMGDDSCEGVFAVPTHWPTVFSRFSNTQIVSPGLSPGAGGHLPFSLQGNTNIGGFCFSGNPSGYTGTGAPSISVSITDGATYGRGAGCIVRLSDNQRGLEGEDVFNATGSVPKAAVQPDVNLSDTGQSGSTSVRFYIPVVSTPQTTALFGFLNSGPSNEPQDLAGWTKIGSYYGGAGSYGIDVGPRRTTVYRKDVVGLTTIPTYSDYITIGSDHVMSLVRKAIYAEGSFLETEIAFGINPTKSTAWNVVAGSALSVKEGDLIYVHIAANTDSIGAVSSPALAATGCSFFSHGNCVNTISTSTGYDGAPRILAFSVTSASIDPVVLTFTATSAGAASGAVSFLVVAAVDAPISQGFLYASEDGEDSFSCPSGTVAWVVHGSMSATEDVAEDTAAGLGWLFNKGQLAFGAVGTGSNGSTSCTPSYPSGITTNDLILCFICSGQSSQNTPTMPTGWTRICTLSGGNGATFGVDVGNRRVTVFRKNTTLGTESGTVTVSLSSGNTMRAHIARFRSDFGLGGVVVSADVASSPDYDTYISTRDVHNDVLHASLNSIYAVLTVHAKDTAVPSYEGLYINFDLDDPEGYKNFYFENFTNIVSTAVTTGNDHRFILSIFDSVASFEPGYLDNFSSGPIGWNYSHEASDTTCGAVAVVAMSASAPGVMNTVEERDSLSASGSAESGGAISGTLSAVEAGIDTAAISGTIGSSPIVGSFSSTEVGTDTATIGGKVLIKGSLARTETGPDTASISGKVLVKGSLARTEPGPDTATIGGKVLVKGSLARTEPGPDTATIGGKVFVRGALSVTESSMDTLAGTGTTKITSTGILSAAESGLDSLSVPGKVLVKGSLSVAETAVDTTTVTGKVLLRGYLLVAETGADVAASSGKVVIKGSLARTEPGPDIAAIVGTVPVKGSLSAQDQPDVMTATGGQGIQGWLSATEPVDAANISGKVLVAGSLGAAEVGADEALFLGATLIQGSLHGYELSDTAALSGRVLVDGQLLGSEDPDLTVMLGSVLVSGIVLAGESEDSFESLGQVFSQAPEETTILADLSEFTLQGGIAVGTIPAGLAEFRLSADTTSQVVLAGISEFGLLSNVKDMVISSDIEERVLLANTTRTILET